MAEEVKGGGYRTLGVQGEELVPPGVEPERVEFDTPLMEIIKAVGMMKTNGIQPHPDKFFHATITMETNTKLFSDPIYQRINVRRPDGVPSENFIGHLAGITFHIGDVDSITGENFTSLL